MCGNIYSPTITLTPPPNPGSKGSSQLKKPAEDIVSCSFATLTFEPVYGFLNGIYKPKIITDSSIQRYKRCLLLFLLRPVHIAKNSSETLRRIIHRRRPSSTLCHPCWQRHLFQSKGHGGPLSIR